MSKILPWIAQSDLSGLSFVQLLESEPDDREASLKDGFEKGCLYNGRYKRANSSYPSDILLYTRDLYCGVPERLVGTSMATLKFALTVAHEVGHHVIATRGYIYDNSESYAPWRTGTVDPFEEEMADLTRLMC